MRLIVFGPGHPFRGGIAATTTALVRALQVAGQDVLFLSARRQYPRWLYPGHDDRDPDACARLDCAQPILEPLNPLSWSGSRRHALRQQAEAWVIPYWTWAWAGLWRTLLAARHRPPTVAIVHNPVDHDPRPWQRWAARSVLTRCDGLFTHAVRLEQSLNRSFPGVPAASHPLAVDPVRERPSREEARARLGLPPSGPVALFFGLIRPYKGVDVLLDALASDLPGVGRWRLVVAGEAWSRLGAELSARVIANRLEERVQLRLGWVPDRQLDLLLAAADLVVLPYRSGSQSAVAPLALAYGIPVLSTRVGGLPEVVRDGVNGRLVEAGSADALAKALADLDTESLQRLADGAGSGVDRLSWRSYAASLLTLVEEVVAR